MGGKTTQSQEEVDPDHLYDNIACTDDDGKIKEEFVLKERSGRRHLDIRHHTASCETEDDSGISDVCTSPRCYESTSSIGTKSFLYDKKNGIYVYKKDSFESDQEPNGLIHVLLPEMVSSGDRGTNAKHRSHVYVNCKHTQPNKEQELYEIQTINKHHGNTNRSVTKREDRHPQYVNVNDMANNCTPDVQLQHVYPEETVINIDPNYENLKPENLRDRVPVYYVTDYNTENMLQSMRSSFRRSQQKWQDDLVLQNQGMCADSNRRLGSVGLSSPMDSTFNKDCARMSSHNDRRLHANSNTKASCQNDHRLHKNGVRRSSSMASRHGKRSGDSRRHNRNMSLDMNRPSSTVSGDNATESRVITEYVKAADGSLRAITLHT